MKNIINQPDIYFEIGASTLLAVRATDSAEWPLERSPDGRLTAASKAALTAQLKHFLSPKPWQPRVRALCAINARGVSVRQLSLPIGAKEEFHDRLLLQIESEFPLSPDELAWGYQTLGRSPSGTLAKQDLLVAAVKKEIVADYQEMFAAGHATPIFTLASLARNCLCPQPDGSHALLDIGEQQSELTVFANGVPVSSRIIFWALGANPDPLAQTLKSSLTGTTIFISGKNIPDDFAGQLTRRLGLNWNCERLAASPDKKSSAAILGLKRLAGTNGEPPLLIRVNSGQSAGSPTTPDTKQWVMRAVILIAALLVLPYLEAILLKAHLAKTVAQYQTEAVRLKMVDRELDFLRYLKQNQPPYLNAMYVFAQSVSPGTKFDSITMNSHGDVSLRASFGGGQQVTDFRSKLIDSGTFTNVIVEEQSPGRHGPQVDVRMTAHWKAGAPWPIVKPPPAEADKNAVTKPALPTAPTVRKEMN
ncbi:MAG TPA: hypothetical protein VGO57_01265 [Verrucomicrobiae bacterium]